MSHDAACVTVYPLELRSFEGKDQPAVWALHNLALEDAGLHAGNGPWDEDLLDPSESYLARGGEFIVGLVGDRIVAMGGLLPTSSRAAEIKRMRVHPDFQRQGFGTRILEELERRAQQRGFRRLHLDTTREQRGAQRIYARHGYREARRATVGPFEFIFYEKELSGAPSHVGR